MRCIGYERVSTSMQASSGIAGTGLSLAGQRAAIKAAAAAQNWELIDVVRDSGISGRSLKKRDGLAQAIERMEAGEASVLICSSLSRISRSTRDFANLTERAAHPGPGKNSWSIHVCDLGSSGATASGRLIQNLLISVASFESEILSERVSAALKVAVSNGTRLGRPKLMTPEIESRIVAMRRAGATFAAIAAKLEEEGVSSPAGKATWELATLRRVCARAAGMPTFARGRRAKAAA